MFLWTWVPGIPSCSVTSGPSCKGVDHTRALTAGLGHSTLPPKLKVVLGPGNNQICGAVPPHVLSANGSSYTSRLQTCAWPLLQTSRSV